MKKIKVLHIAEIDNDAAKGTSAIIPDYVIEQKKSSELDVSFLNCNDTILNKLEGLDNIYMKKHNENMKVIDKVKPQIVVFHELYKPEYLKIYKYLIKKKIPYIIIPHGGMTKTAQNIKKYKKIPANCIFFNNFFKKAKAIQYLSDKEEENSKYRRLSSYVLGNGINDIPSKNLYLLSKNKRNNDELKLIYVGRYDYIIKGLDQLLEAMKSIKDDGYKNIKLTLFGKGKEEDCNIIKKYIDDNKLEDIVSFNGPIFGEEKRKEILKHDIFIQVSRTEGQPLGVMEAMSLGMPVLLSEGTGYQKVVINNEIGVYTTTNKDKIYDSIIKIMNKKNSIMRYSANSYYFASMNYSWREINNLAIEKYKELIMNNE